MDQTCSNTMNHSPNPSYQRIGTPNGSRKSSNETRLFIIVDSEAPITIKVPAQPGQLTLGDFKEIASLHNNCYKYYFQSHDAEFGTVKEEIIEDDAILPVEDGRVVAWVLSNENNRSTALFDSIMDNNTYNITDEVRRTSPQSSFYNGARANPIASDQFYTNSQPSSPAHIRNGSFSFNNGKRLTPPRSPTCIYISLHLDSAQPLGLGHVYPGDDCQTSGIIVDHVQYNSVAERDGRIKGGDRIVEVNGVDLRYLRLGEAIHIFKQFVERGGNINLVIQRPSDLNKPPALPPKKTPNRGPCVPPRLPVRDLHTTNYSGTPSNKVGFDPATELPDPIIEPSHFSTIDNHNAKSTRPYPIVNFGRPTQREHQRASQSLPRSLTPRSWYTTGNLDDISPANNLGIYQMDSRSDYEPTNTASLRSNLYQIPLHCGKDNIQTIYEALRTDSVNLEIKDREWLKVVVKDSCLGSSLIKWLSRNIYGFCNRSEVKRYANQMLALGLIRSPMSKATFSEKCLYTLT